MRDDAGDPVRLGDPARRPKAAAAAARSAGGRAVAAPAPAGTDQRVGADRRPDR